MDIERDLVREGSGKEFYARSPIPDGTVIALYDGPPSPLSVCAEVAAFTLPSKWDNVPRLTDISLEQIRQKMKDSDKRLVLDAAFATEICQQHGNYSQHQQYKEVLCNGFGMLIVYITAHIEDKSMQNISYEDYLAKITSRKLSLPDLKPEGLALFSKDFYQRTVEQITEVIATWDEAP